MEKAMFYIFVLSLVLVGLAYYVGLSTDAATFFAGARNLVSTATGRNAAGQFAAYPTGG
jgi:hypothetical protein